MRKFDVNKAWIVFGVSMIALTSFPAAAAILVDETNTSNPGTNYSFNFYATGASSSITFAGYQVPSFSSVKDISVQQGGVGPNLLGLTWLYTPAPFGAEASQFDDGLGTGTNALSFGGVSAGSYDIFSQAFSSIVGQSYTLNYLYTNPEGASGFRVEVGGDVAGGVPEPATWAMMLLGFGLIGAAMRRKQRQTVSYNFA